MKKTLVILTLLITVNLYSNGIDTLKINSQIKNVTVFFDGAQITRQAEISVAKGKHLLVLDKLPAEVNPQSIQVVNNQKGEILSVKHEFTYPNEESKIVAEYEGKIKEQEIRIKEIVNEINVFEIEEDILLNNSILNKKGEGTTITEIKEASTFYRAKLNEIRQEKLNLVIELDLIKEKIQDLYLELNRKVSQENKTYSKVSITIDSETAINSNFEISYYVSSAGWSPLYDFRVNSIKEPLNIVYNSIIYQSTGENWKNVNLTLSTNTPSVRNNKPELRTWFINRENTFQEKKITDGQSALKGKVSDQETGESIPFANIVINKNGEMIAGSTSDFDGRYTIKPIKSGYYDIIVSFIGYTTLEMKNVVLSANKITFQDFKIKSSIQQLDEVQIVNYMVPLIDKDKTYSGGTVTAEEITKMPNRSANSVATTVGGVFSSDGSRGSVRGSRSDVTTYYIDGMKVSKNEEILIEGYTANTNITNLEYKIDIPYTIPSDGKDYTVKIKEVNLPVEFVYYSIPKIDKDVFLVAEINNWTKLNLLSGNTSVYYKGTFTGQSEIDANSTKDTLSVSLNRDKNIIVERTLQKEKNEKQLIGKNVKEIISWNITIKNNKDVKAKIIVKDQFPISEIRSIEIEKLEFSNGKINNKTGEVIWELELEPNEKKELILKYSVKYPNYMKLKVE